MTRPTIIFLALACVHCSGSDRSEITVTATASEEASIVQFEFVIDVIDNINDDESGSLVRVRLPEEPSAVSLTSRRFGFASDALAGRELVARVSGFDENGELVDSGEVRVTLIEDQSLDIEIVLARGVAVDAGAHDANRGDGGPVDGGALDGGALDGGVGDAGNPDGSALDAALPDASVFDASFSDASPDASQVDAPAP